MICNKCGFGQMVDDSCYDVKVLKCWACGNRLYVDHPKRWGFLVCSRCGNDVEEENEFGYCKDCLRLLAVHDNRMKERTYGKTVCTCGAVFTKKSPTQTFHSRHCRSHKS